MMARIFAAILGSALLHGLVAGSLVSSGSRAVRDSEDRVRVKIVEKPKKEEKEKKREKKPEEKSEPKPPPKPKKKKPKKKKPEPQPTTREPKEDEPTTKEPLQGLTKESVTEESETKTTAPVGNTLMVEDTGERKDPDEIKPLDEDLSRDAVLRKDSVVIPDYTMDARDVGLEGVFPVDVFVNKKGEVVQAELARRIGYGMDERVLEAARNARFKPRRNKYGKSIPGWTVIKFNLVLE